MSIILVVEDEPATQIMLELILRRINHKVIAVEDGQKALSFLSREPVDLMIADVNMPGMNGLMMLQQIRDDKRYQNLPIIMFTANGDDQVRLKASRMGASGFLTKPASSKELIGTVEHHLGKSLTLKKL